MKLRTGLIWLISPLLITIIINFFLAGNPKGAEDIYYRKVYPVFRFVWDLLFSWLPVPIFYLWIAACIFFFLLIILNLFGSKIQKLAALKLFSLLLVFNFCWFYWSWGFNYNRIPLGERWNINNPVSEGLFESEFNKQSKLVDSLRITYQSEIDSYVVDQNRMEDHIRQGVIQFQKDHGYFSFDKIRCRILGMHGVLLVWSTAGVYLPFIGESQLDGGLHKLSKPFTMAHELCHGMGWTHEGDCNFMAYLICSKSGDPFIRYSGEMAYWRYLYANASRVHPELFAKIKSQMNYLVLKDIKEINEANNRYPEIFPALREWFYDWYLKQHGIASGDKSYSEIIRMVINYKTKGSNG